MWRTTGRATAADLADFPVAWHSAGANKLFVVSPQSKQLAGMIAPNAPMGAYFRLLFAGDHRAAARLAWKNAEDAKRFRTRRYFTWVFAAALAARCHDQEPDGRAAKFVQWAGATARAPHGYAGHPKPAGRLPRQVGKRADKENKP